MESSCRFLSIFAAWAAVGTVEATVLAVGVATGVAGVADGELAMDCASFLFLDAGIRRDSALAGSTTVSRALLNFFVMAIDEVCGVGRGGTLWRRGKSSSTSNRSLMLTYTSPGARVSTGNPEVVGTFSSSGGFLHN